MNIFYTDKCPVECAKNLDDKRVVKMITETAQLLSSGLIRGGYTKHKEGLCKMIPQGKELASWCVANKVNYLWALSHMWALNEEYIKRYNKKQNHGAMQKYYITLSEFVDMLPDGEFTAPPNWTENKALNISYKDVENTELAYNLYLADRWETDKKTPTWYGVER